MRRKKGFTLVELLVAIVCATLVLSMVSAAAVFLSRVGDGALNDGQTYYQLQTLKAVIKEDVENNQSSYSQYDSAEEIANTMQNKFSVENGSLIYKKSDNKSVTFSFIEAVSFKAEQSDSEIIVRCIVTYDDGQTYKFVAYAG